MKKHFIILSILAITTLLFSSCWEEPRGSFTLQGRLLSRTDSTAVSGHQITVMYLLKKGGLSGEKKRVIAGSGKSDSSGYFVILCDYYMYPDYFYKENDLTDTKEIFPRNEGDTVEMDALYVYD